MTIRDIAQAAGVSPGTVSRALKSQQGMSEATRAKVLEAAARLGYGRDHLRKPSVRRVLFLLHKQHDNAHSNLFYAPVLHGVEEACRLAGIALSFAALGPGHNVAELVRLHGAHAIVCAGYFEAELLQAVQRCGLPLVAVDHFTPFAACINDDNYAGAYAAVQHLLARGYQRIAFISGPVQHHSIRLRERGYRKALFDAQVLADPDYVVAYPEGLDAQAASVHCMDALLALPTPPDAVFAYNDMTALAALHCCQRQGLRVPEDIGICGYDGIAASASAHPPLSTVLVDKEALGRAAVAWLLQDSGSTAESMHPVQLVVRESSAGPGA